MSKIADITDKLNFDTNPVLKIKNTEVEIQSDAETMLKIIGLFDTEESEIKAAMKAADLIFSENDRKKLKKLNLSIWDYATVVGEAMNLAMGGGDDERGEK